MSNLGLVLSGGGARTAFQVGVLKAINEWHAYQSSPFKVISGVSAGAINAAFLSAYSDQFSDSVNRLVCMWRKIRTSSIYQSSLLSDRMILSAIKLLKNARSQSVKPSSVLDAFPLARLLSQRIEFNRIQHCLDQNHLHSLAITATNYHGSLSTTFVQSNMPYEWQRARRNGVIDKIKLKHLMASTAIPFLFSPVRIQNQFYGDGSLRNFCPMSPVIQCSATRMVVIGVRGKEHAFNVRPKDNITFGDIFARVLNTILFDSLDVDFERLTRINATILSQNTPSKLKPIDAVVVYPSVDFCDIAEHFDYESPPILNQLLSFLGSKSKSDLQSYLLFEPGYLHALIDQGYKDAQSYKDEIIEVINKKSSRVGGDKSREL